MSHNEPASGEELAPSFHLAALTNPPSKILPYIEGDYVIDPLGNGASFHLKKFIYYRDFSFPLELTDMDIACLEDDSALLLQLAEEALDENPQDTEAFIYKAIALGMKGNTKESLALNEAVLSLEPDNLGALHNRSLDLMELGRFEEALFSIEQSIQHDPSYVFAHAVRGDILLKMGRFEEAREAYETALTLPGTGILAPYQHEEIARNLGFDNPASALEALTGQKTGNTFLPADEQSAHPVLS